MRRSLILVLTALLAFGAAGGFPAAASGRLQEPPSSSQQARWDDALDRYEKICNLLISLKARVAAGESVDASETASIVKELDELKILLSHGNGEMTASQKTRFRAIGDSFRDGRVYVSAKPEASAHKKERAPYVAENHTHIIASIGLSPFVYGGMVIDRYGYFGGYVKVLGTMNNPKYSYTTTSAGDAIFEDGSRGKFWGRKGSETKRSNMSFTAGFDYSPKNWVDVFLGVGYGWDRRFWTDEKGKRVLVSDFDFSSIAVETGAVFNIEGISFMLGLETISFKTCTPYIGVGVYF